MNGIDVASNSALLKVVENLDKQNALLASMAANNGALPVKDWASVQAIVRMGMASKVFSIGDQLVCKKEDKKLVWDIIGIDHDIPSDKHLTHSMTLQLNECYKNYQIDAAEALYYCAEELSAGTYYFTIHNYDEAYGGNRSYYFTLANPVPAGGQIDFRWGYNSYASASKIKTYSSSESTVVIEEVNVTEGTEGTFLGVTDGSYENMNRAESVRFGSNRWGQSAIRQWLNSDAENNWWVPSSKFDRSANYASTAGFLKGMDEDFLSVMGKVNKRTALSTVGNGVGYEDSDELMFLLSRSEVYGGAENGVNDGNPYAYYKDYSDLASAGLSTDSNRIKYLNDSASYWWLRSASTNTTDYLYRVSQSGSLNISYAINNNGIAPACCIV